MKKGEVVVGSGSGSESPAAVESGLKVGGIPVGEVEGLVRANWESRGNGRQPRHFNGWIKDSAGAELKIHVYDAGSRLGIAEAGSRTNFGELPRVNGHYEGSLVEGGESLVAFHVSGHGIVIAKSDVAAKYRRETVQEGPAGIQDLARQLASADTSGAAPTASVANRFRKAV